MVRERAIIVEGEMGDEIRVDFRRRRVPRRASIVSLLARFRVVTRVSRAFKDRATRDELVLIVLTRESSATRPSAGWRRRATTDVKARTTIHRPVRALFSRARTGETPQCADPTTDDIMTPRSVCSFTVRALASSRLSHFCVQLARTKNRGCRHENARVSRAWR